MRRSACAVGAIAVSYLTNEIDAATGERIGQQVGRWLISHRQGSAPGGNVPHRASHHAVRPCSTSEHRHLHAARPDSAS